MKSLFLLATLFITSLLHAQIDSLHYFSPPNEEYVVYHYDSTLLADVLSYEYLDVCDLDNDGQKDNIIFTSNGGAHAYYNLKIWLSSNNKWIVYPSFYIDMPYLVRIENITELNGIYPQLVIHDFDNDKVNEVYLNLNNSFASIPQELINKGVNTKEVIIDYNGTKLVVHDLVK